MTTNARDSRTTDSSWLTGATCWTNIDHAGWKPEMWTLVNHPLMKNLDWRRTTVCRTWGWKQQHSVNKGSPKLWCSFQKFYVINQNKMQLSKLLTKMKVERDDYTSNPTYFLHLVCYGVVRFCLSVWQRWQPTGGCGRWEEGRVVRQTGRQGAVWGRQEWTSLPALPGSLSTPKINSSYEAPRCYHLQHVVLLSLSSHI